MNKRHYEHTLPNIRGSLSNTYDGYSNFVSEKKEKAGSGNSFLQSGIAVGIETAHPPCPEVKERQAVWKDERMYMSWFRKGWT